MSVAAADLIPHSHTRIVVSLTGTAACMGLNAQGKMLRKNHLDSPSNHLSGPTARSRFVVVEWENCKRWRLSRTVLYHTLSCFVMPCQALSSLVITSLSRQPYHPPPRSAARLHPHRPLCGLWGALQLQRHPAPG